MLRHILGQQDTNTASQSASSAKLTKPMNNERQAAENGVDGVDEEEPEVLLLKSAARVSKLPVPAGIRPM